MVWILFGEPPQQQKPGKLIVFISILLIVVQTRYLSRFTSDVVKPFDKFDIDSNQKLFDSGYKILVTIDMSLTEFAKLYTHTNRYTFQKLKLDSDNLEQYFVDFKETEKSVTEFTDFLFLTRDEGTVAMYRKMRKQFLMDAESRVPGTHCHMLKEPQDVYRVTIFFKGHLAELIYSYLGNLISSGLSSGNGLLFFVKQKNRETVAENLMQGEEELETASMKTF